MPARRLRFLLFEVRDVGTLAVVQILDAAGTRPRKAAMLQQILRSGEWEQLAEPIRFAHEPEIERRGKFRIGRGRGLASRFLARIFRLPETAAEVEARLLIVAEDGCERWQRWFAGTPFRTLQSGAGDSMIERWGYIEVHFAPRVENGCLRYEQTGA